MPERGWYSITVRVSTAKRLRERANSRGLTVDQCINELLDQHFLESMVSSKKGKFIVCSICGKKVKVENLQNHIRRVHPREMKR